MKSTVLRREFLDFFSELGYKKKSSKPIIESNSNALFLPFNTPALYWFDEFCKKNNQNIVSCQKWIGKNLFDKTENISREDCFYEMLITISNISFKKELENILKLYEKFEINRENIIIEKSNENIEIYYDMGDIFDCNNENCEPGCNCGRYLKLSSISSKKIGNNLNATITESRLENFAMITQEVTCIEDIDLFEPLMNYLNNSFEINYGYYAEKDNFYRIVANYARTLVMLLVDGYSRMEELEEYVEYLIIKISKAILKLDKNSFQISRLVSPVLSGMQSSYPGLSKIKEDILIILELREEKYIYSIGKQLEIIDQFFNKINNKVSVEQLSELKSKTSLPDRILLEILSEKDIKIIKNGEKDSASLNELSDVKELTIESATTDKLKIDFLQELYQCKRDDVLKISIELVKRYKN